MRNLLVGSLSCLTLSLASLPAGAASTIVTPGIHVSSAGSLECLIVNASQTKTLEVEVEALESSFGQFRERPGRLSE